MPVNLALLSGEISGDMVGGALSRALRAAAPEVSLWGIGSRHMAASNVELLYDSADWSAIGVINALRVYPHLRFWVYPHTLREILKRRPATVVLIDFGAFNVQVARWCKARGIPVLYYFPPGSWRRSGTAGAELARITDRIATPFPWSAERLARLGAQVEFVGHPLLEIVRPGLRRAQFTQRFGMEPGRPIIGLLPGSRRFEVKHNTPALLGAARLIQQELPGAQFVFGAASASAREQIEDQLMQQQRLTRREVPQTQHTESQPHRGPDARLVTPEGVLLPADVLHNEKIGRPRLMQKVAESAGPLSVVIAENMTYDVMAYSDVLLVCSGTATLEAAILGTPMIILYRGSRLMEIEYNLRRLKRLEHIGMPNIIAGRRIVPELIQQEASPEALARHALRLLRNTEERARMKEALGEVRHALGEPGASDRVARIALEMAGYGSPP